MRSLGRLDHQCREWDDFLATGGLGGPRVHLTFEIPEEAGIAADSVLHYLNLCIDDLARIVHFVVTDGAAPQAEPDRFSVLVGMFEQNRLPGVTDQLERLFTGLRQDTSWWAVGFRHGVGMRQRLTHYTDLLVFSGRTKPGDAVMTADVALAAIGERNVVPEFGLALRQLLAGLCEWLDALTLELLAILSQRLAAKGVTWDPFDEKCSVIELTETGEPRNGTDYLYLPICET